MKLLRRRWTIWDVTCWEVSDGRYELRITVERQMGDHEERRIFVAKFGRTLGQASRELSRVAFELFKLTGQAWREVSARDLIR